MISKNFKFFIVIVSCIININLINSYHFEICTSITDSSLKEVETLNGKIKGECYIVPVTYSNETKIETDVLTWLSIPYAEPPNGNNRFKDPIPVLNWSQPLDTLTWPKSCLQQPDLADEKNLDEDCLYLNVFIKRESYVNRENSLRPILVFIHGGALATGTSSADLYEPSTVVSMEDIIVVTINYRLNIFGFLHLADTDASGNQGFLDQNLALKWVYDNARKFGGDKTKITISGESAGAWSVGYHLFYPKSWPYFRNAILQSGTPNGPTNTIRLFTSKDASDQTKIFAEALNCSSSSNKEIITCLQNLNFTSLMQVIVPTSPTNPAPYVTQLVMDNKVFSKRIDELSVENSYKECNIITGYNTDEVSLYIPGYGYDLSNYEIQSTNYTKFEEVVKNIFTEFALSDETYSSLLKSYFQTSDIETLKQSNDINFIDKLIDIGSDAFFITETYKLAEIYSNNTIRNRAYVYELKYKAPNSFAFFIPTGFAAHGDDLAFLFGQPLSNKEPPFIGSQQPGLLEFSKYNYTNEEKALSQKMINYWANFVKYDNPNGNDIDYWKSFVNDTTDMNTLTAVQKMNIGRYLLIDLNDTSMKTGYASHNSDFWGMTLDFNGYTSSSSSIYEFTKLTYFICISLIIKFFNLF